MPPKAPGKDIRSFFTSISSKASIKTEAAADKTDSESALKKKKVRAIIDSDSDDGGVFAPSKPSSKKVKEEKPNSPVKKEKKPAKPLTPLKPVDIKSVFGDAPIKRSKEAPEKRKRKTEEHDDDAFTAALEEADQTLQSKKPKSDESKPKEKEPVRKKIKEEVPNEEMEVKSNNKSKKEKGSPAKSEKSKKPDDKTKLVEIKSKTPTKKIKTKSTDIIFESPPKKEEADASQAESPSFDPLEKRKQKSENYRKFLAHRSEGPKNPGSKTVPEGASGCMEGLTVVVTGVLESLHRDEAEELVRKYGGKVTHSISKNTSYVLAGDDAGPSKMTKAKDLNVAIITEDEFLEMIASRPSGTGSSASSKKATPKSAQKTVKVKEEKFTEPEKTIKKAPEKKAKSPVKETKSPAKKTKSPELKKSAQQTVTKPSSAPAAAINSDSNTEAALPWVDKYKPTSLKQIIGQQGASSNAKKLMHWLQHWYENHSGKKKLTKPSPWSTNDDGAYFKAALLSGPPGIGKTTTAHLVSKELGYDLVEMNASDTRSKRLLHEHVTELLSCHSLSSFAHGSSHMNGKKRVLVMDEVDGMAGNEDRGGMQELIGLIKSSKIPVICICNDRQHPKVRSLSNYCYDLKFSKPTVVQIRGAMMSICFKEGVKLKPEALDEIATGANKDIRQVLHHLSMLSSKEKSLSTEQAKLDAAKSKKDFKMGPWDVVKKVFSIEEHQNMSMMDKTGLFFQDYSLGPLFVQENYLQVVPHAAKGNAIATLDLIARTADSLSTTDLIEKVIRSQMAWSLLPVEAMFASVIPGQLMEGRVSGQISFPSWLGKNSRQNKMDRLLQELQLHMRLKISASKRALNLDYLPHVINSIVGPLRRDAAQGVDASVKAMENYDLMREDLDSLLEVGQWPNRPEIMAGIDGKVKAAFTRAYNKEGHLTPYAAGVKTSRGRTKVADDADALDAEGEEADDGGDGDASDDDDVTHDAMIKIKKTAKKAAPKKETVKKETVKKESARGGRSARGAKSKRE